MIPHGGFQRARRRDTPGHHYPLCGTSCACRQVFHVPRDAAASAESEQLLTRGHTVAPVPADRREHPYGGPCPACTADRGGRA